MESGMTAPSRELIFLMTVKLIFAESHRSWAMKVENAGLPRMACKASLVLAMNTYSVIRLGMLASLMGSYIPFPRTEAERQATGDPRESVERYGGFENYRRKFAAVCDDLREKRYLLKEDADRLINERDKLRGLFPDGK